MFSNAALHWLKNRKRLLRNTRRSLGAGAFSGLISPKRAIAQIYFLLSGSNGTQEARSP